MSEHCANQDQDIEYEIIIELNDKLVESDEIHQDDTNPFEALDDADNDKEDADDETGHETTGSQSPA